MTYREEFGRLIAAARADKQLTQAEFGAAVGVSNQQVSRWERGAALPKSSQLRRIAEVLGLDLAMLASLVADASQEEYEHVRRDRDRNVAELRKLVPLMRKALSRSDQLDEERLLRIGLLEERNRQLEDELARVRRNGQSRRVAPPGPS